ncbi:MAG: hypothetical protein C4526_08720 [Nitrospiraceae bacterium]|nr:MAG: hypothetical protein C4526_08720 [Nitrospiraceae bacterium]
MMAFFLLMWLLNMTSEEKRARLSQYFRHFSIYDQSGSSFMDKSSEMFNESGESNQKTVRESYETSVSNLKEMEEELKAGLMKQLGDARDQVIVDTVEGGVRIQMTDKEGSLMFDRGSNRMTPKAREILHVIYNNIKDLPNKLAIEGHTDSLQYAGTRYSNWELSTERASSARRELEANGLNAGRIERVSGFADKDPLIAENPEDPRNRRISIILKVPETETAHPSGKPGGNISGMKHNTPDEMKDEGSLMVDRFKENLSLIKNGKNQDEKKSGENTVDAHTDNAPVTSRDSVTPENKSWGPVIKKDDWSPVIKDELKPVMKNSPAANMDNADSVIKKAEADPPKKNDKPVLKNLHIPVSTEEKKDTAAKEANKKPAVIKELSNPVISKDDLFR